MSRVKCLRLYQFPSRTNKYADKFPPGSRNHGMLPVSQFKRTSCIPFVSWLNLSLACDIIPVRIRLTTFEPQELLVCL